MAKIALKNPSAKGYRGDFILITSGKDNNFAVGIFALGLGDDLVVIGECRVNDLAVSTAHGLEHDFSAGADTLRRHAVGERHERLFAFYAVVAAVDVDVNELTPRKAFDIICDLKEKLDNDRN